MESAVSSETSVTICQTPRHNPTTLISRKVRSEGLPILEQPAATSCMGLQDKQQAVTKAASRTAMSARQKNNTFVQ